MASYSLILCLVLISTCYGYNLVASKVYGTDDCSGEHLTINLVEQNMCDNYVFYACETDTAVKYTCSDTCNLESCQSAAESATCLNKQEWSCSADSYVDLLNSGGLGIYDSDDCATPKYVTSFNLAEYKMGECAYEAFSGDYGYFKCDGTSSTRKAGCNSDCSECDFEVTLDNGECVGYNGRYVQFWCNSASSVAASFVTAALLAIALLW